jgi:hypothetical protein
MFQLAKWSADVHSCFFGMPANWISPTTRIRGRVSIMSARQRFSGLASVICSATHCHRPSRKIQVSINLS